MGEVINSGPVQLPEGGSLVAEGGRGALMSVAVAPVALGEVTLPARLSLPGYCVLAGMSHF